MKVLGIITFLLCAYLLTSTLDFHWLRKAAPQTKTVVYAELVSVHHILSMPCTWISKTGPNEPLAPQCVNADLTERKP